MGNTVDTYTTSVAIGRSNCNVNTWEPLITFDGITYWYPGSPGYEMNEDVEICIRKVNDSTGETEFYKRFKIHIFDFLLNYNLPHGIATVRCLRLEDKLYFSYFMFKKHPSLLQKGRITGNLYFSA